MSWIKIYDDMFNLDKVDRITALMNKDEIFEVKIHFDDGNFGYDLSSAQYNEIAHAVEAIEVV